MLLPSFLLILLGSVMVLMLHLQMASQLRTTEGIESRLYSLVLAENGVEFARKLLPALDLNQLLRGPDGVHSSTEQPEWRNPIPLAVAQREEVDFWTSPADDGLPAYQGRLLLPAWYRAGGKGYFLLRFSNNPEEPPESDSDYTVLVRSMGIVTGTGPLPYAQNIRNQVTLVEARLRKEMTFRLPSPLTLMGDAAEMLWEGTSFSIEGVEEFAIATISLSSTETAQQLRSSLSEEQFHRISGQGQAPSVQDATFLYQSDPTYSRLFQTHFWRHFEDNLHFFADPFPPADPGRPGLFYLPQGGEINGSFSGLLISHGDLRLQRGAALRGLLLHLGKGQLSMGGNARITGAVWMSNLESGAEDLTSLPVRLRMGESAQIQFDTEAIMEALSCLPATQLGWRVIFPEMLR